MSLKRLPLGIFAFAHYKNTLSSIQMSKKFRINKKKTEITSMDPHETVRHPIPTTSKVYAEVFRDKSSSFFDYESFNPTTTDADNYSLIRKIGQGKYSLVFEAIADTRGEEVVIKLLKPIKKFKIKREIKILEHLRHGVNIVSLVAVINIPKINMHALVFESSAYNVDFRDVYLRLNETDIRYYTSEILKALDFCHSRGVMHRDVKPHNIIVNQRSQKICLIDFGLAEFYQPGERYNVRVASRHYKGPELLVDYGYYDYSLDLWSLGCMFAAMIFRKEPFFQGSDNRNQLKCIVKVLGTTKFYAYLHKYNIHLEETLRDIIGVHNKKPWQAYVSTEHEHLVNDVCFEFLDGLLCYDHMDRLTAWEALNHKYFIVSNKCSVPLPVLDKLKVSADHKLK